MIPYCPNNSNYTFREICCRQKINNDLCNIKLPIIPNFICQQKNIAPQMECNFDPRIFLIGYLIGSICSDCSNHPRPLL